MRDKSFVHVDFNSEINIKDLNSVSSDVSIDFGGIAEVFVSENQLKKMYESLRKRYDKDN